MHKSLSVIIPIVDQHGTFKEAADLRIFHSAKNLVFRNRKGKYAVKVERSRGQMDIGRNFRNLEAAIVFKSELQQVPSQGLGKLQHSRIVGLMRSEREVLCIGMMMHRLFKAGSFGNSIQERTFGPNAICALSFRRLTKPGELPDRRR